MVGVAGVPVTFVGVNAVPVVSVLNRVSVSIGVFVKGGRVAVSVGINVADAVPVTVGERVEVGKTLSVCAALVACNDVAVAGAFFVGTGLTACCRNAGMHALRPADRQSATSRSFLNTR